VRAKTDHLIRAAGLDAITATNTWLTEATLFAGGAALYGPAAKAHQAPTCVTTAQPNICRDNRSGKDESPLW